MSTDKEAFILAETTLRPTPHVPEVQLHVADESTPLWLKTEEQLAEIGLPPPFWAFAWAGGQALARYLLDHPETVHGRYALDFACGSGIVGIAAMKAGANRVLACDIDTFAIAATQLNAATNSVAIETVQADLIGLDDNWDTVLAGDICYERDTAARVIDWLETLHRRGAQVLIGDPGRSYLPKNRLEKIAEYMVPTTRDLEDNDIKRTAIWRFA